MIDIILSLLGLIVIICLGLTFIALGKGWDKAGGFFMSSFLADILLWIPIFSIFGLIFENNPFLYSAYLCTSIAFWILIIMIIVI